MRGVGRIVGERLDALGGGVGLGEQGAPQDLLAPVFGGADRGGEQAEQVGGGEVGGQQVLVLGFPQHGDRVDRLAAVHQRGQARKELSVQRQGEVVGLQPAHLTQPGGLRGRTREQRPFLLQGLLARGASGGGGRRGTGQRAGVRGEPAQQRVQETGQGVAPGQDGGGRVGQRPVGGGPGEALGVLAQGAAGVVDFDHPGVGRRVPGPGTPVHETVQIGGGQPGRLRARRVEDTAQPHRGRAVLVGAGHGSGAHRRVQGAVGRVAEMLGSQRAESVQAGGLEEEGAEQGLLGVVHRGRGMGVRQSGVLVGAGNRHVGHQAARVNSSGPRGRPRCGASRWAASRGGTALPIWENCWPLLPAHG